ncbi:hypothetical protein [Amorphus orientalis]|uniref:Uncharacterized protein n=1 Tax=Amorphus orientalis TaxID=649198 RepID=A0AAE3VPJ5_9HYPH|nr:hypothetical protein [Amorphus orientalis]MDQ0316464.1 hypothetical protein [Amorphus orientalis]
MFHSLRSIGPGDGGRPAAFLCAEESISRSDWLNLNEKELLNLLNLEPFLIDQVFQPDRKRL